jgi:phosphosulfolactate synthase
VNDLLELPDRAVKPREVGITHVLDRGLSVSDIDSLIEVAGDYVDVVKLGWGTALVSSNLEAKIERYRHHGIPVVFGGTLLELAISQGRLEPALEWMRSLGIGHVEISDGTIAMAHEEKLELIERLAGEFTVMSEVGSKDDTKIMAPYRWVELIERELEAGAWKVVAEARESGTSGIFRHDGEVRMGLIDEIVHAIPHERMLFEAPRKSQQVWFIRRLGANVNLGNVIAEDVLSLETMRLGLRADTALGVIGSSAQGAGSERTGIEGADPGPAGVAEGQPERTGFEGAGAG